MSNLTIKNEIFEVKTTVRESHLGGKDCDNQIVNSFITEFKCKLKTAISENKRADCYLRTAYQCAKCKLSSSTQASIETESLYEGINFYLCAIEELNAHLFCGTLDTIHKAL